MPKSKPPYPEEFRREAVELLGDVRDRPPLTNGCGRRTKERLLHHPPPGGWATRAQLRPAIFEYIEGFYRLLHVLSG